MVRAGPGFGRHPRCEGGRAARPPRASEPTDTTSTGHDGEQHGGREDARDQREQHRDGQAARRLLGPAPTLVAGGARPRPRAAGRRRHARRRRLRAAPRPARRRRARDQRPSAAQALGAAAGRAGTAPPPEHRRAHRRRRPGADDEQRPGDRVAGRRGDQEQVHQVRDRRRDRRLPATPPTAAVTHRGPATSRAEARRVRQPDRATSTADTTTTTANAAAATADHRRAVEPPHARPDGRPGCGARRPSTSPASARGARTGDRRERHPTRRTRRSIHHAPTASSATPADEAERAAGGREVEAADCAGRAGHRGGEGHAA